MITLEMSTKFISYFLVLEKNVVVESGRNMLYLYIMICMNPFNETLVRSLDKEKVKNNYLMHSIKFYFTLTTSIDLT